LPPPAAAVAAAVVQVAAAVGIPAEDVHAGIKPAGKAALVEKLKAQVSPAAAAAAAADTAAVELLASYKKISWLLPVSAGPCHRSIILSV
jgi:hypothetical protein